jgi:hypothetical protein
MAKIPAYETSDTKKFETSDFKKAVPIKSKQSNVLTHAARADVSTTSEEQQSRLMAHLNEVTYKISIVNGCIYELTKKLAPVLSVESDPEQDAEKSVYDDSSESILKLKSIILSLDSMQANITSLYSRLDT